MEKLEYSISGNNKGLPCPFQDTICQEGYCRYCQIYINFQTHGPASQNVSEADRPSAVKDAHPAGCKLMPTCPYYQDKSYQMPEEYKETYCRNDYTRCGRYLSFKARNNKP